MIFLPLALLLATPTDAATKVIATRKEKFLPSAQTCAETRSCGLTHVTLHTKTKETLAFGDKIYSADAQVVYETRPGVSVEDYVFVQLIKGCMYTRKSDGATFDVSREFWGKSITFHHPEWVIDNTDASPYFTSYGARGAYALLRWNADPKVMNSDKDPYYFQARPSHRTVYMSDNPGQAYHSPSRSLQRITSLQFRTCLLHKDFVDPLSTVDGDGVRFDKAVKCFEWSNNFAFSKAGSMSVPSVIDPVCLGPSL